jgi:hypothetical protein
MFLKYAALSTLAQLLICIAIWVLVLLTSPALDGLFEKMIFFYWPVILLLDSLAHRGGESAMFGAVLFGMLFGMVIYGGILGLVITLIIRRKLP